MATLICILAPAHDGTDHDGTVDRSFVRSSIIAVYETIDQSISGIDEAIDRSVLARYAYCPARASGARA